jgi:hypothetical protein
LKRFDDCVDVVGQDFGHWDEEGGRRVYSQGWTTSTFRKRSGEGPMNANITWLSYITAQLQRHKEIKSQKRLYCNTIIAI